MSTEAAFDGIRWTSDCATALLRLARSLLMCRDFQIAPPYLSQYSLRDTLRNQSLRASSACHPPATVGYHPIITSQGRDIMASITLASFASTTNAW